MMLEYDELNAIYSNILPLVMWSKYINMVGVGPGVGADVIRQRRKRADKLKKEQQVVVIHWVQMKFRDV